MIIRETVPEMGAPYPLHRGPRLDDLGRPQRREPHEIVHPEWPPRAPKDLAPSTVAAAALFDRVMRNYGRA